ncbi:MAG: hypothetical protein QME96_11980, partial [Myxococcota bacterium]|nr:hypothetical protein [Myxococcota bacterium]
MDATGAAGLWLIAMIGLAGCEAGPHFVPPGRPSATMEPASGRRGTQLVAIVRGTNTRFLRSPGALSARFSGDAVLVVGSPRVEADDRIRLLLSIPADAPEGPTSLVLEAPPDRFELPFAILPPAVVASARFVPDAVQAGFEGAVDLVGSGTRFSAGVVSAAFEEGSGIRVVSLDVERDDLARVGIAVSAAAPEGVRRAAVGAGGLILSVPMRVVVASGPWVEFDPPAGRQGGVLEGVVVRGHGIEFVPGDVIVEFPFNPGVTVPSDGISTTSGTEMTVRIEIAADAREGPATSRVRSGGAEARGVFRVLRAADDAPAVRFSPAAVCAGERAAALHILGTRTSFRNPGTTARSDYHPGFVVGPVAVLTPTNAIVTLSVDRSVPEGIAAIAIETPLGGGDPESVTGVVDVLPPCASMTLSPDVFEHPGGAYADRAVDIVVAGVELTGAARLEVERGGGIAVRSFSVFDASRASAVLRISGDAEVIDSTGLTPGEVAARVL